MGEGMSETVSTTVSNLLPLLGLLAGIFLVLIIAAVALRYRVRRPGSSPSRKRSHTPADMQAGDVLGVLGKTFQVDGVTGLTLEAGEAVWCSLSEEGGPGRLLLTRDLKNATYFPGHSATGEDSIPEKITREEGDYQRIGEPLDLEPGWKLGRYQGPAEKFLALEIKAGQATLWRGKSIPPEGVRLIEDKVKD